MSTTRHHSSLAASALSIYLNHSFQAALAFKTKLNSCSGKSGGNFVYTYKASFFQRLQELVLYLQESISKPMTLHALAGRLAVIDRLKNSIPWSVLGCTPTHQSGGSHEMCKHSADFLRFSIIAEEQGDLELCKEWVVASQFSDLASNVPQEGNTGRLPYRPPETSNEDRIEQLIFVAHFIMDLLADCPSLIPRGSTVIVDHFRAREKHLLTLSTTASALRCTQVALTPADERIHCLYKLQCDLLAYSLSQLSQSNTALAVVLQEHSVRESFLVQLAELRKRLEELLSTLDACETLLVGVAVGLHRDLPARLATLCQRSTCILRDLCAACAEADPVSDIHSNPRVWTRLLKTVQIQLDGARKLQPLCRRADLRNHYLSLYTAEATRSAQICPYTQYQQKVTECWELATATVATESYSGDESRDLFHWRYAALAEGIFASAVTCHTQWERAVERRDDKLADFWQRARERAWEVGCNGLASVEARRDDPTIKPETRRVAITIHLAICAQELSANPGAHPFAEAEADLRLLVADMLVTNAEPDHRNGIRHAIESALEMVTVYSPAANIELPGILPAATTSEEVRTALHWCACMLTTLYHLRRVDELASDEAWPSAFNHVIAILAQLKANDGEPLDVCVLEQRRFTADLFMKLLEGDRGAGAGGEMGLEWLSHAYESILPEGRFLEELSSNIRTRIVQLRLQFARALEAEATAVSAEIAQSLQSKWPLESRPFSVVTTQAANNPVVDPAVVKVVSAYQSAILWKQQAAEAATNTALRRHLEDGSACWAALADHRLKWAEHCEHEKVESLSLYGRKGLKKRGKARKLTVKAMEAGLRALQSGDTQAHTKCLQVCKDLSLLNKQIWCMYTAAKTARPGNIELTIHAMGQILFFADHTIRAVRAGLDGKAEVAAAWQAVADTRDKALVRSSEYDLTLRCGCEEVSQRADELAEQARLLESGQTV